MLVYYVLDTLIQKGIVFLINIRSNQSFGGRLLGLILRSGNRNGLRFLRCLLLQTCFFHSSAGHFIFRVILIYLFVGGSHFILWLYDSGSEITEEAVQKLHCRGGNKRPGLRKA